MKKSLLTLVLLLLALMVPMTATAAYDQLAEGVYLDGTTLYITSGVTSLGDLQVDPNEIYCYATIPPACVSNTFSGYGATLHVPAAGMVSYFTALYWYNFNNILSDAIEPLSVTMNTSDAELEIGQQLSLSASVAPSDATPKIVYWSSTDPSVATVSNGGTVTAVAEGECDIFATCVDKVAACHVSVPTMEPPLVTITLNKHKARVLTNHTLRLTATCSPIDVDLDVTSSNPGVAIPRLVNGTIMVVGVAEGTATITVNAADGWGEPDSCEITVYTNPGDVNRDGYVNISDVTRIIDYLLSDNPEGISVDNADTNRDEHVNISDVTALIDYLLSGKWSWESEEPDTETFTVNGISFKMITVDCGTYTMGATTEQGEDATDFEKPAHEVSLSSFSIGETEVTQALWVAVMGNNPSKYKGDMNRPVEMISWNDCQTFIAKLNELTGRSFRLPTEAEWEYAARGGIRSKGYKYAGSNNLDDVAWYYDNLGAYEFTTKPTATKAPNELGIFDMSGNVNEWVQDWYGIYNSEYQINPLGPFVGSYHLCRGGCWGSAANGCRVSHRDNIWSPEYCGEGDIGMRLALDIDNSTDFGLSELGVVMMLGHSKEIGILNGNGNYSITGGSDLVNCVFNSNSLVITGKAVGDVTVYITDLATDTRVQLRIVVKDKDVFTVNGISFTMVAVEGGTFMMGASDDDTEAYDDERPAHQVTLSSFCIGETEVTQELWKAVMGSNPSYHYGSRNPVEEVGWGDCDVFINKLNELTGRTFRLPTEAEWEYAARGGNKSKGYLYSGSNNLNDVACYRANAPYGYSGRSTDIVAVKAPNELGIYDMSGNVWEWCLDWYGSYSEEPQINPTGPESGPRRVSRGGSYLNNPVSCRVSNRNISSPSGLVNGRQGLRLAL